MQIVWSGLICGSALAKQGPESCCVLRNVYIVFRTWGLVLVDFRPASWRAVTGLRLAKNAELVVLRGGEPGGVGTWPEDWLKSRCRFQFPVCVCKRLPFQAIQPPYDSWQASDRGQKVNRMDADDPGRLGQEWFRICHGSQDAFSVSRFTQHPSHGGSIGNPRRHS